MLPSSLSSFLFGGALAIAGSASCLAHSNSTQSAAAAANHEVSTRDYEAIRVAYEANRHAVHSDGDACFAFNPRQQMRARFDGRGLLVEPTAGGWTWGLELREFGFAGRESRISERVEPQFAGQRAYYEWGSGLQEWYVNDGRGLEHGFTLLARPPRLELESGPLTFTFDVLGDLDPEIADDGRTVRFVDAGRVPVLIYSGLKVWGADGADAPSRFERTADGLRLTIAEDGVRYPLTIDPLVQQAYLKASNPGSFDQFGEVVAVSGDTVVVGAALEFSGATGVNGNQSDNSVQNAGAAYVFVRNGSTWTQQAYLKASNTAALDQFGRAVAISGDTIVVGAWLEDSGATGVNGNQNDNSASSSGAAYVFVRNGTTWSQQAYLKASNTGANDWFGLSVAVSGETIVIGAYQEDSDALGVNGNQASNAALGSGAAYVFTRNGSTWSQQAYLKASNTQADDLFGQSVSISGDTIAVGASGEDSNATGIDGDQANNAIPRAGAAYVFARDGATWSQQAYLKASSVASSFEDFGSSIAISGDAIVVGSIGEDSNATGVNGDAADNSSMNSGASYVFARNGATWSQQAYLKASNTGPGDGFGFSVGISGNSIVVGANGEDLIGDTLGDAGAIYVYTRTGATWSQLAYVNASNPGDNDQFGRAVAISADTVVSGAFGEDSSASGVNGNQSSNGTPGAGAAYVIDLDLLPPPWATLGSGLAGVNGIPQFVGKGTLIGGDVFSLTLTNAKPSTSAALIVGLTQINAPLLGGTLVPSPDIVIMGLPTSPSGEFALSSNWQIGLPAGITLWMQLWVVDPAGPAGASASNAISATTP